MSSNAQLARNPPVLLDWDLVNFTQVLLVDFRAIYVCGTIHVAPPPCNVGAGIAYISRQATTRL